MSYCNKKTFIYALDNETLCPILCRQWEGTHLEKITMVKLKKNNTYTAKQIAMGWSCKSPTHYQTKHNENYLKTMEKLTKLMGYAVVPTTNQTFQLVGDNQWKLL